MIVVGRLRWDPGSIAHIARHGVTHFEVEEVCQGFYITRQSYGGRYVVIGETNAGRVLAVALEFELSGHAYVVTARPASRRERRDLSSAKASNQHE